MAVIHTTACEELIRRIEGFADTGDLGSEDYFSTASSIAAARKLLSSLYECEDDDWPRPVAGPSFDDGVDIFWRKQGRELYVHVPGDSQYPIFAFRVEGGMKHIPDGEAHKPELLRLLAWVSGEG